MEHVDRVQLLLHKLDQPPAPRPVEQEDHGAGQLLGHIVGQLAVDPGDQQGGQNDPVLAGVHPLHRDVRLVPPVDRLDRVQEQHLVGLVGNDDDVDEQGTILEGQLVPV